MVKVLKVFIKIIFIYSLCFTNTNYVGVLKGQVFNAENQLPLAGSNIFINGTDIGTISDEKGLFIINDVPQGYYNISASYMGYELKTVNDIWIRPNASDFLKISLIPKVLNLATITVENNFFSKSIVDEYSSVSFNNDEIRRAPGAGQEVTRILNSLPSVASVGENRQDMMVRGGGPTENGFIIDNIPIPSVSHFQQSDGRSNGPIGIINTDMVESLEFYANGFSSKYGNKLSSYGEIKYREGNNESFEFNLGLGLGGLGGLIEGPLFNKSSFIASYRKSYLNVISDLINAGGLPSYQDIQGKITYKPDVYNIFSFLYVNGSSLYDRSIEDGISTGQNIFGKIKNNQNTLGINFKHIWNKKAYTNTSLGFSIQKANTNFYDIIDSVGTNTTSFSNLNSIKTLTFRNVTNQKISNLLNIEYGFEILNNETDFDFVRGYSAEFDINEKVSVLNSSGFISIKNHLINRIILSSGARIDFNDYEKKIYFSPRINIDCNIFKNTNLVFNFGNYLQNPPEIYLSVDGNNIGSVKSNQTSLSLENMFFKSTKISLSIYNKTTQDAPILGDSINYTSPIPQEQIKYYDPTFLMDQLIMYDKIVSKGRSTATGIELLIQKKRVENFYGLIGGTIFNSLFTDIYGNQWSRNYNYKYIFNIVGGYRPNSKWEVSIRWSLFGGKPYTPFNENLSILLDRPVREGDQFNSERTPEYHSLFLRYEKRVNLKRSNLIYYIELWNAYNRKNIETFVWSQGLERVVEETYFDFIPVGGFEIEF